MKCTSCGAAFPSRYYFSGLSQSGDELLCSQCHKTAPDDVRARFPINPQVLHKDPEAAVDPEEQRRAHALLKRRLAVIAYTALAYSFLIFWIASQARGPEFAPLGPLLAAAQLPVLSIPVALVAIAFRRTRGLGLGLIVGILLSYPSCLAGLHLAHQAR